MRKCAAFVFIVLSIGLSLAASPARADGPRLLKPEDVASIASVRDPQISPDGKWVAYTISRMDLKKDKSDTDVWMSPMDPKAGEPVRLTTGKKSENTPRWSPDGKYLAFLAERDGDETQVYLLDRRGGEAWQLTEYKASVSDLAWSPDGKRLALLVSDVDPDKAKDDEKKDDEKTEKPIVIDRRQFKRDGEGYLREIREHLYVFDLATKTSVQVTSGKYDDSEPAWSPDGKQIAFTSNRTSDPDANQNTDVFVVEAKAGATPRAVTTSPGADASPAWSPDGKQIAYVAGGPVSDMWYGISSAAIVPAAGGTPRDLTRSIDRNISSPRFSPDGQSVYFLLEDGGNQHLARVPAKGGAVERVVSGEREIDSYDLGPKGEIALAEAQWDHPNEISAVGPKGSLVRLSHANDEFLKGIRLGKLERYQVASADGTKIDAFLTRPPDAPEGKNLPAILRIHGGPTAQFTTGFELEWQMLAAGGYAVVAANPRGSTGYGRDFCYALWADWGNKDFQDVMAAVDGAISKGVADPERLGVGGWSYGGILTDYVITKTTRFKAATSGASEANYFANYGTDHYQYEWETELGLPWRNFELWKQLSPWFHVDNVKTPTLLLGGQDDFNVPLLNSEQLYQAIKRLGIDTELIIYPGQNHGLRKPSYLKDRFERYLAWYDKYLKPGKLPEAKRAG
ncbi:MAG TPA: S9 family peptidase [Thermoanaerobaculia bacterium]|nr:S9 family peptidase [Thermoanaerobaculia bacterium]